MQPEFIVPNERKQSVSAYIVSHNEQTSTTKEFALVDDFRQNENSMIVAIKLSRNIPELSSGRKMFTLINHCKSFDRGGHLDWIESCSSRFGGYNDESTLSSFEWGDAGRCSAESTLCCSSPLPPPSNPFELTLLFIRQWTLPVLEDLIMDSI